MSMHTTLTADPDDFRRWPAELDLAALEPLTGPRVPQQWSRAAANRDAARQIGEGYDEWLTTGGEA